MWSQSAGLGVTGLRVAALCAGTASTGEAMSANASRIGRSTGAFLADVSLEV